MEPQRSVPQVGQWPEAAGQVPGGVHDPAGGFARASSFAIPEPEEARHGEGRAYTIGGIVLGISLAVITLAILVTALVLAIRAN